MLGALRFTSAALLRRVPPIVKRTYHHGYVRKPAQALGQKLKVYSIAAGTAGFVYFAYQHNLETVPITGRQQFMLYLPEEDLRLGKQELESMLAAVPKCTDKEAIKVLETVSRPIAREVDALGLEFEWEFHLLDSPDVNAMCLPGGKVVVFTGLLKALYMALQEGDINNFADGLAFVIAHEIGHAVARHGMEKLSRIPFLGVVQVLFSSSPLIGSLESMALDLPMDRTMETEADLIGMELMARACFNPAEAANVQMMLDDSPVFLEYFRTHPVGSSRKKACDEHLPHAIKAASEHCVVCCDHNNRCRLVKQHMAQALHEKNQTVGWFVQWLNWIRGVPQPPEPVILPVDPAFWRPPPGPASNAVQGLRAKKPRKSQPPTTMSQRIQSEIAQLLQGDNIITRGFSQERKAGGGEEK